MKLYDWKHAPNTRRVRMYLAEKGLDMDVPREEVGAGWGLQPSFLAKSPQHRMVPLLELDDGTLIGEAMAICRYFETLHPEPCLMGRDAKGRALIEMWERKCESQGLQAATEVLRNALPGFVDRAVAGYDEPVAQLPALVQRGTFRVQQFFALLNQQLAQYRHVAGDDYSVADITALCSIDFAKRVKLEPASSCTHLLRWYHEVSARPSSKA